MTLRELTAEIIGAPVAIESNGETVTGTVVGFGWGMVDDVEPETGRVDFYGGASVTLPLDADAITIQG